MKNITRFYAVGRAVFAEIAGNDSVLVAVCEFNDAPGVGDITEAAAIDYKEAIGRAEEIAKLLTKNYPGE